ncbi:Ni/Fe-hydrogenase cytochrome b subunit [Geomonas limicola]|uniref:Ni/Fe-hydrogenase cytochrome b subunit n=1 Tax=Geomonas limicola TaxID=2740186 RepID=A0A6V8N9L5_9BACT|nr:Ni/Fe-hydrogenase cytochrome b subunit [Geomonas limicola]GFO69258.1 Ni/Fe-hydrogenase cytochrome b subunit [Geomonas limicola]
MLGRNKGNSRRNRRILTRPFFVLLCLALLGLYFMGVRFTKGIGAVSNLSDGYPWGIWVAYDVAIGTAITCGGYAVAVLLYIRNSWRFHPLIKSAILISLFGSCLAASSVIVDIGRPWNAYGFFVPTHSQPTSALFQLAIGMLGFLVAQCLEYFPGLLQLLEQGNRESLWHRLLSRVLIERSEHPAVPGRALVRLNHLLIGVVAVGIILPTIHQSALGSLMLIASTKLHPIWHTAFLPLLFLINCIYLGYGMVVLESLVASLVLERDYDTDELAQLARLVPWLTGIWLMIRVGDLVQRDQVSAVFHGDFYSGFFLAEFFLLLVGAAPLFSGEYRRSPRWLFISAALILLGGGLYRFNVYLIGFDPGAGWHYFPSFAEVMIPVGIVSLEVLGYQLLIKMLPEFPEYPAAQREIERQAREALHCRR